MRKRVKTHRTLYLDIITEVGRCKKKTRERRIQQVHAFLSVCRIGGYYKVFVVVIFVKGLHSMKKGGLRST